jgi:aminoglycoside/choline kinase family phosphotransferase
MAERLKLIRQWLQDDLGRPGFTIAPASADASFRRYFRVQWDAASAIVMDAPPEQENCAPFIDITARLLACAVHVPSIHACDLGRGFLLLDDLGQQPYLDKLQAGTVERLYTDALAALLRMQECAEARGLPPYDERLLRREMALFSDWLVERHLGIRIGPALRSMLDRVYALLVSSALAQPQVFVHRDFHSRNLMLTDRDNPGILDYQDAVHGPATYDLVSLLKDCYIKWPRPDVLKWVEAFRGQSRVLRRGHASAELCLRWFDLMGVQRHLKASGIFARLLHRDGKPGFVQDIPRTLSYITDLEDSYPELRPLAGFLQDQVLPELERTGR